MNKLVYIFFLFCFVGFSQSDSINNTFTTDNLDNYEVEKKTFDPNFKEKYSGNEFNYETVVNTDKLTAWDRFWDRVNRFFSDLFDFGNLDNSISGFNILMKIIAFLIVAFVIYMIVKLIINKEGGWIFAKSSKKIMVSEVVDENIHTIDFESIIKKSKQESNYRLTIRYYYLWLLKSFSDANKIEWDIEKTNSDYLLEIKSIETKEDFQYLSYVYDYIWYGEFEISEIEFKKVEATFIKAMQKT